MNARDQVLSKACLRQSIEKYFYVLQMSIDYCKIVINNSIPYKYIYEMCVEETLVRAVGTI